MASRVQRLMVLLVGLSSLGADKCAPAPGTGTGQNLPIDPNYYCYTDPPVGCAAYCSAVDVVTFNTACKHISAGPRELDFELYVITKVQEQEAQGVQACPEENLYSYITPCQTPFPPVQWPNQGECTPPPAGCPVGGP